MKVLVSNIMMLADKPRFEQSLARHNIEAVFLQVNQFLTEEQLLDIVGEFDGWLAGDDQITRKVLQKSLPKLKVISKWGTGIDSIDLTAAKELGIPVYNSPGAFRDAVAEIAIGYMLNLARKISWTDRQVRQGRWPKDASGGLVNKKLGIIGYGAIGRGIAERALAMKMHVSYYDIFDVQLEDHLQTTTRQDLDSLLAQSDFICLACNLKTQVMYQDIMH